MSGFLYSLSSHHGRISLKRKKQMYSPNPFFFQTVLPVRAKQTVFFTFFRPPRRNLDHEFSLFENLGNKVSVLPLFVHGINLVSRPDIFTRSSRNRVCLLSNDSKSTAIRQQSGKNWTGLACQSGIYYTLVLSFKKTFRRLL